MIFSLSISSKRTNFTEELVIFYVWLGLKPSYNLFLVGLLSSILFVVLNSFIYLRLYLFSVIAYLSLESSFVDDRFFLETSFDVYDILFDEE